MAPKRKLADDDSKDTTRTTRSSTRTKTAATKSGSTENVSSKPAAKRGSKTASTKVQEEDYHDIDEKQPAKKSRTTKNARGKKQQKAALDNDDESGVAGQRKVE